MREHLILLYPFVNVDLSTSHAISAVFFSLYRWHGDWFWTSRKSNIIIITTDSTTRRENQCLTPKTGRLTRRPCLRNSTCWRSTASLPMWETLVDFTSKGSRLLGNLRTRFKDKWTNEIASDLVFQILPYFLSNQDVHKWRRIQRTQLAFHANPSDVMIRQNQQERASSNAQYNGS